MSPALGMRLVERFVAFGRALRAEGLDVSPAELQVLLRALERIDATRRSEVKAAARTVLVHRRRDVETFERLFDRFWSPPADGVVLGPLGRRDRRGRTDRPPPEAAGVPAGRGASPGSEAPRRSAGREAGPTAGTEAGRFRVENNTNEERGEGVTEGPPIRHATWSDRERLLRKDLAELSEAERRTVEALLGQRLLAVGSRVSRRRRASRRGSELDLRRSLRSGLATGGELIRPAWRRRRETPRPLVALLDISGSMEPYLRMLLQFLYLQSRHGDRVECFAFGTRLTRLTRHLTDGDPDTALRRAAAAITDWAGGTQIGEALRIFNRQWGRRVLGGGAVVLVISDGWDRGEPELVATETERLSRNAHRLLWLNPLAGLPGYRPATRALEAALPHVDEHLPVENLASLEHLVAVLAGLKRPASVPAASAGIGARRSA